MDWIRPTGKMSTIMMVVIIFTLGSWAIAGIMTVSQDPIFIILLVAPILLFPATYVINRLKNRGVWHSPRLKINRRPHLVVPEINKVLTEALIPYTLAISDQEERRPFLEVKWDQVFNLDHGDLNIHLLGQENGTILYLGPEKKGNRDEFARIKALVERVASDGGV